MKTVATHDSEFHADDVFAMAVMYLLGFVSSHIRTRDPQLLAGCDMRIDVGGKYDEATDDYDHHQKGGAGIRENGIPYAAFGLIWKRFGLWLCGSQKLVRLVDERLVQVIDARDNGWDLYDGLRYPDAVPYLISDAVLAFNPSWHENPEPDNFDEQFFEALEMAKAIIMREIAHAKGYEGVRRLVRECASFTADARLLVLPRFCKWQDVVAKEAERVFFVVFPHGSGDRWLVQAVPESKGSHKVRRQLPAEWAGKNGSELAQLTGVDDAIFCHNARFVAGAWSKEGALKLAELALM